MALDPMALGQLLGELMANLKQLEARVEAIEVHLGEAPSVSSSASDDAGGDLDLSEGGLMAALGDFEKMAGAIERLNKSGLLSKLTGKLKGTVTTNGATAPANPVG